MTNVKTTKRIPPPPKIDDPPTCPRCWKPLSNQRISVLKQTHSWRAGRFANACSRKCSRAMARKRARMRHMDSAAADYLGYVAHDLAEAGELV